MMVETEEGEEEKGVRLSCKGLGFQPRKGKGEEKKNDRTNVLRSGDGC